MYVIVIIMSLPFLSSDEFDSVTVTHYNGTILDFRTQEACRRHVSENIPALKVLANQHFPGRSISTIDCFVPKEEV